MPMSLGAESIAHHSQASASSAITSPGRSPASRKDIFSPRPAMSPFYPWGLRAAFRESHFFETTDTTLTCGPNSDNDAVTRAQIAKLEFGPNSTMSLTV